MLNVEVSGAAVTLVPCLTSTAGGGRIQGLVINRCPIGDIHENRSVTIAGNFLGTTPQGGPVTGSRPRTGAFTRWARCPRPDDGRHGRRTESRRPQPHLRTHVLPAVGRHSLADYTRSRPRATDRRRRDRVVHDLERRRHFLRLDPPPRIGGPGPNEGNVVGGSLSAGVFAGAEVFQGNFIGTNPTETRNLGNLGGGLVGGLQGSSIGGLGPGEGNVFAWNGGGGVSSYPGGVNITGNTVTVRGNRFYGNAPVGIALGFTSPNPADPGDADTGPNGLQNAPIITGIDYGPPTVAHAILSSAPSMTYDVDSYANLQSATRPTGYPRARSSTG